jgi:hypothetical protein
MKFRIALAAAALTTAGAGAVLLPAHAAEVGACTVSGTVTVTPGPQSLTGAAAGTDNFAFSATTIACNGTSGVAGTWSNVTAAGTGVSNTGGGETCAEGTGSGNLTGGTNGTTGDSIVAPSAFTFERGAAGVVVKGTIDTASGHHATFVAQLTFQPTSGGCAVPPGTGQTVATMNGTAEIQE